jgi:hypothetical protein
LSVTLGATSRTFTLAAAGAAGERTQAVLLRGLSDATEVATPTSCLVLPHKLHAAVRPASTAVAGGAAAWFSLVCSLAEGKAAELAEQAGLVETVYLYLVDEVTGEPVDGPGYPIEITHPKAWLTKYAPFFKAGLAVMGVANGRGSHRGWLDLSTVLGLNRIRWQYRVLTIL